MASDELPGNNAVSTMTAGCPPRSSAASTSIAWSSPECEMTRITSASGAATKLVHCVLECSGDSAARILQSGGLSIRVSRCRLGLSNSGLEVKHLLLERREIGRAGHVQSRRLRCCRLRRVVGRGDAERRERARHRNRATGLQRTGHWIESPLDRARVAHRFDDDIVISDLLETRVVDHLLGRYVVDHRLGRYGIVPQLFGSPVIAQLLPWRRVVPQLLGSPVIAELLR